MQKHRPPPPAPPIETAHKRRTARKTTQARWLLVGSLESATLPGARGNELHPDLNLLPVNPLIEVAQDARRDTPDVTAPVRNLIIVADDAVPVATLAPIIFRAHEVFQRNLEDVGDLG